MELVRFDMIGMEVFWHSLKFAATPRCISSSCVRVCVRKNCWKESVCWCPSFLMHYWFNTSFDGPMYERCNVHSKKLPYQSYFWPVPQFLAAPTTFVSPSVLLECQPRPSANARLYEARFLSCGFGRVRWVAGYCCKASWCRGSIPRMGEGSFIHL